MRSSVALAGAAAAASAAYLLYRMYGKKAATALPVTMPDKDGMPVVVRLATIDDLEAVKTRIADHTGTGSGTGGDDFLIQEFTKNVVDPNYTVLFAETTAGVGLGMTIIAWSGNSMMSGAGQSYWQSLRVAQDSRGRGIAQLLFKLSARFAIERQGPDSVSRWGIVSNNDIMMTWSKKMKLHGPEAFRRYGAPASDSPVPLPAGYKLRAANNDATDRALIMRHVTRMPIAKSKYGTQNFLRVGWGELTEDELDTALSRMALRDRPTPPAPQLLFDASGELIAFAVLSIIVFGPTKFLMKKHCDGTTEGVSLLMHQLPRAAKENACDVIGGYSPALDWVLEILDNSPAFKRQTQTEQMEFEWKNADFA